MKEEWRKIQGQPIHSISNLGRIRNDQKMRILKPWLNRFGYMQIRFHTRSTTIHRCVAETFLGKKKGCLTVNHKNGNKLDNRLSNLELMTSVENAAHGRKLPGFPEATYRKLSDKEILRIKALLNGAKIQIKEIAFLFAVSHTTISRIKRGWHWKLK